MVLWRTRDDRSFLTTGHDVRFMAVLFGQLAVTAQATEVNVIYDKAYQSQTDVKAFFRARAMESVRNFVSMG